MCLVFPLYTTGIIDLSNSRALSSVDITRETAIKTHGRLPRLGPATPRIPPLSRIVATPPLVRTSAQTRRASLLDHPSSSLILYQLARPPRPAPRTLIATSIQIWRDPPAETSFTSHSTDPFHLCVQCPFHLLPAVSARTNHRL